jgi:tetratricopeptide (TPR) repeat protein
VPDGTSIPQQNEDAQEPPAPRAPEHSREHSNGGTEVTAEISQKLADLDAQLQKFESQKRWPDVIKTLLAKADVTPERPDKVELLSRAGALYVEKSANQAEAIKCFEQVLQHDALNERAIRSLKEMYEKRRDWEKLIRVMRLEGELLPQSDRGAKLVEIAKLATERVRKPELCIELWQAVLEREPDNLEALQSLSGLYERARKWDSLAAVLESLSARSQSNAELLALLQKLGMIYADKLSDDQGAVSVFERVLQLDPQDRRAQEQLKRRYVALHRWDDMESFYAPLDRWDELIRLLEREAENQALDTSARVELLFRIARLWDTKKGRAERATKSYEKVLELDPENVDAAVALTPAYQQAGDPAKLARVYEIRLKASERDEEKVELLSALGRLYEQKLQDPQSALDRYLRAFRLDPAQPSLRADVARVAAAASGWEMVIETFSAAVQDTVDDALATDLRLYLGHMFAEVGRTEDAIEQYQSVFASHPERVDAAQQLEELLKKAGKFTELLALLDQRLGQETDESEQKRLSYQRAELSEHALASSGDAIDAYRSILERYGEAEVAANEALERLYTQEKRYDDLAQLMERRIEVVAEQDELVAELKLRLARTYEQHLGQQPRAIELYREILLLYPEHSQAQESLEKFLSDPEHAVRAAQILEPIYEVRGEWQKLISVLEVLATGAFDVAESNQILNQVAELYLTRLDDAPLAFSAYGRAFQQDPYDAAILESLERTGLRIGKVSELIGLLTEVAQKTSDAGLARSLWMKVGGYHEQHTHDLEAAIRAYGQIVDVIGDDVQVLQALERVYEQTERFEELVAVLRRRVDATASVAEKLEWLSRIADLMVARLKRPNEAIRVFREMLELDPSHPPTLEALDSLLEKQELWSDLADHIGRRLSVASSDEVRVALMLRLALLQEERMHETHAAIEIYREVLEQDPTNEQALGALERLLGQTDHQLYVAEILEPLYRAGSEFAKLIRVYEIQAKHAGSKEQRVDLLHRIAELYEAATDSPEQAFSAYSRALREDPGNPHTQEQLERMARAQNDWKPLAHVYEEQARSAEDPNIAALLHTKSAEIYEHALEEVEPAIAHYRRVLELDPAAMVAADALERLYQRTERHEELAGLYLAKAKIVDSPDDEKAHMFQAAALYEQALNRPKQAIEVYRAVLALDPEDLYAMDRLSEQYARLGEWDSLLEILSNKVDVVVDIEEKKSLLMAMGDVHETRKENRDEAIHMYQRVLELDPDDRGALSRLDELYQSTGNWRELLAVLEHEAELAQDYSDVVSFRYRTAMLWDRHLEDSARAVEGFREILAEVPEHEPSRLALEEMIRSEREVLAAVGVLAPLYRSDHDWPKLIAAYETQIRFESEAHAKVALLHEIARLHEFQLDNARAAFSAFAKALEFDVQDESTLQGAERLAGFLNAWPELVKLYDAQLHALPEDEEHARVLFGLRVAGIYELQLDDLPSAIERYKWVLKADASNLTAIEALDRLYQTTERWQELTEILHNEIQIAASPDEILRLQYRLGQTYERRLQDVSQAIEQYREILGAAPEHPQARAALESLFQRGVQPVRVGEILEPIYRMQQCWADLITVYQVQIEHLTEATDRVALMHRIAEIAEERLLDHHVAFAWFQQALKEDPLHEFSEREAQRLARLLDGWDELANSYVDIVERSKDPKARVHAARQLAVLYESELHDVQRAEETFRYILTLEPQDASALQALDRLYVEHGAYPSLAEILRRRADTAQDLQDRVDFSYRLADVLDRRLHQTEEAVRMYQYIVTELDPQHLESVRALQDVYMRAEDWPSLMQALDKELHITFGDSAQSDIYARMARLASDAQGDLPHAVELWKKVLDLRGEDPEALNALGNLYAQQENWRDLVDVLEREAAITDDSETRIQILSDLARVWFEKLQREKSALDSWQRVLEVDPANVQALFSMAAIHRGAKDYRELVATLHTLVDVAGPGLSDDELEHVYMQIGEINADALEQPFDAIDAYRHALEVNPHNVAALRALERLYSAERQWEQCVRVLEQQATAQTQPEDIVASLMRLGEVWQEHLLDADHAAQAYDRVLAMSPNHVEAFERLEKLYRTHQRWESLIEMYLQRAEVTEDVHQRVPLIRNIAHVYEQELGDKEKAFEALQLAWSEDYTDRQTADDLEALAGATQKWTELLSSANEALTQIEDPELKIAICLNCARWYGVELGHPQYALPYYNQILEIDPTHVPTIRQMADLYRTTQQWQVLAQVLGRLVEVTPDPQSKADVYVEMGELCEERLGIPDQAHRYYQQALDTDPQHVGALTALEREYRNRDQWDKWVDVVRRKAAAVESPSEANDLKISVAHTLDHQLRRTDEAERVYNEVREADPENLAALRGLERIYASQGRSPELRSVLEAQLELAATEKERVTILCRLAEMWEQDFLRVEKSIECLERVVEIDALYLDAYEHLVRLYKKQKQWAEVIHTLERYVASSSERDAKVELYKAMGDVYERELRDSDRALDAYQNALELSRNDVQALRAIAELYESRQEYHAALDANERLAKVVTDPQQVVELRFRIGRLLSEHLEDRRGAIDSLQAALFIDPGHLPTLETLRKIYVEEEDWPAVAKTLQKEADVQPAPVLAAKVLVELGRVFDERLDDHARAIASFEAALAKDPDNEEAAVPLAEEYVGSERYQDAIPLLQSLTRRAGKRPVEQQHQFHVMLGQSAAHVGDSALAVKAYSKAHQLDAGHLPTLMGLADAYFHARDWDNGFKFYQMLLVQHRDELAKDEIANLFYRLGSIKREQGDRRKAINMFDKALEEDPYHRPTLESMIQVYEAQSEFEQVIHFKQQLLQISADDERFALLEEIGDLWSSKLRNQQKAIESYQEIADTRPTDHKILHKLLALYQDTRQWEKSIDVIERISALDERPAAKAKYAYTVGVIFRDELKNVDEAIVRFNDALDMDPMQLKPFEAINKILTQKRDWKQLERAFRKMLHRVTGRGNVDLEIHLWHNLGLIYRDRLKQLEAAAESFEIAEKLNPNDVAYHQILTEIYAMLPGRTDSAVEEHHWLLRNDPTRVESYRQLYKIYFETRAYDKAWCVAAAMVFMRQADAEQRQFYEQYLARGVIRPQSRLDHERWVKGVYHPDEDVMVGRIFELITPAVLEAKKSSDKAFGLNKKHQVDPATSTAAFAKSFGFVAQVLNLPPPRLFLRQDLPGGLAYAIVSPPASVCGNALLMGVSPQDLSFVVAKHLSYYRPDHYVRRLLPSAAELKVVLLAAVRLAGFGPSEPAVDQTAASLAGYLQPADREALKSAVKRFMDAGARTDIKQWIRSVELTSCRAGLLICNDLEVATRMLKSEPPEEIAELTVEDKIRDMVLFSISENYFRLRQSLGIQIKIG